MRYFFLVLLLFLTLNCSSSDDQTEGESMDNEHLENEDQDSTDEAITEQTNLDSYMLHYMQYPLGVNPADLSQLVALIKNEEGRIIERIGGIYDANVNPVVGFKYSYSDKISDIITYNNNTVSVERVSQDPQLLNSSFKRTFVLDQSQRITQKIIETSEPQKIDTLDFAYDTSGRLSSIRSRDETNLMEMFYYFNNNGNLDSVVSYRYNGSTDPIKKIKELFSGYDNAENPIKDLFIFEELFFRALSTNNYSSYLLDETDLVKGDRFSTSRDWDLKYDINGNVIFHEL